MGGSFSPDGSQIVFDDCISACAEASAAIEASPEELPPADCATAIAPSIASRIGTLSFCARSAPRSQACQGRCSRLSGKPPSCPASVGPYAV